MRVGKTLIGIKASDLLKDEENFGILWVTKDTKARDIQLPEEFKKYNYEYLLPYVTFICYSSLGNHTGKYTMVILDECQHITVLNSVNLLKRLIAFKYILGLTGTPPKDHMKQYILKKLGVKEISKLTVDEAADAQIISEYQINVLKFNLDNTVKRYNDNTKTESQKYNSLSAWVEISKQTLGGENDIAKATELRRTLLYSSKARKNLLKRFAKKLRENNQRGIVFTSFKKDAESLGNYYHGTSTDKYYDQFAEGEINQLVLVKKGSVAHTYYDIDYVFISQLTKDFTGATTQSWGRGLMYREGIVVQVYILCAKDTVEEQWLESALEHVDPSKVKILHVI